MDRLLALLANTRLAWEIFPGTNTLAYFVLPSATKSKSFMRLTPDVNVIKLFSFVTDDEA
jgi:hypothetical protein